MVVVVVAVAAAAAVESSPIGKITSGRYDGI